MPDVGPVAGVIAATIALSLIAIVFSLATVFIAWRNDQRWKLHGLITRGQEREAEAYARRWRL